MAQKTRGTKLADGLYMAVDAKGNVTCAYQGGPRLYVNGRIARRAAGFGGRVFQILEGPPGHVYIGQVFA